MFQCQKGNNDSKTITKDTINSENNEIKVNKTVLDANDSIKKNTENNVFLTNENAMFFLADYAQKHKDNKVRIETRFGNIDLLLFNETKYHRANFIYLTQLNYFDNTQFFRVVPNFIIQGGNSDDIKITKKRSKIGRYLLPNDTKRGFKHHRGVVSMPSSDVENPHKMASPYQFFIVQKKNGAYHLDGDYTIFGKVIKGMDVVDKIAEQETDSGEWPLVNIYMNKVYVIP
ncbi:MAG: peptidylprolyl isomerase [Flavobacteriaceae bacterium]